MTDKIETCGSYGKDEWGDHDLSRVRSAISEVNESA
jgi:hypothetical protein